MKDKLVPADLNYESEYEKMVHEREKMLAEIEYLRAENKSMETEFHRMRAQLDIVYLIFGGK